MVCARLEFVWRGTGLGAQVYGRACVPGHWQLLDRGQGGIGAQVWGRWGMRSGVRWVRRAAFGAVLWARFGLAWAALGVCFWGCALIGGVGRGECARTVSPNNVYGNLQYWGWSQCDLAQVFGM